MAIVLGEQDSDACIDALEDHPEVLISAGTLAEALVVSGRRSVRSAMARLLDTFDFEVAAVTGFRTRHQPSA